MKNGTLTTPNLPAGWPYRQCMCDISLMSLVHLYSMDLNLLLALDALLEERSVTRAAGRLGLSQPAASRALGRLRAALGDELLVRAGRALVPTPRAVAMRPELRGALERLGAAVGGAPAFDPAVARRTFHLATADYGMAVLLPPLLARLTAEAPHVDLLIHPQSGDQEAALAEGRLDLLVVPRRGAARGLVWTRLIADDFVCLVRSGHPAVGRTLSLARYVELGHVFVAPAQQPTSVVDEELARRGLSRRIAVRLPSFLAAGQVVARTGLVATLARRVAELAIGQLPVRIVPVPLELPRLTVSAAWHERVRRDPGHAWFRRLVAESARGLERGEPGPQRLP